MNLKFLLRKIRWGLCSHKIQLTFVLSIIVSCTSHKSPSSSLTYTLPKPQLKKTNPTNFQDQTIQEDYPNLKNIPEKNLTKEFIIDALLQPENIELIDSNLSKIDSTINTEKPFRIQLLSIADFEKAQVQKNILSQTLREPIDILFDPPFYKLRYGKYATRKEANNYLTEINRLGIKGFVIEN